MALYFIIFFAKMTEVTISTLRIMMVNRGEKLKGACLAFVEIIIWVMVASNVLKDVAGDPIKVVLYAAAFSIGNYIGVTLEQRLAIGYVLITAILSNSETLQKTLRDKDFGVTKSIAEGLNGPVDILYVYAPRKRIAEACAIMLAQGALYSVSDVRNVRNGYF